MSVRLCLFVRSSVNGLAASVRITWKPEYARPPHLFSLPHRAHAVAENLDTEGPTPNSITARGPRNIFSAVDYVFYNFTVL